MQMQLQLNFIPILFIISIDMFRKNMDCFGFHPAFVLCAISIIVCSRLQYFKLYRMVYNVLCQDQLYIVYGLTNPWNG